MKEDTPLDESFTTESTHAHNGEKISNVLKATVLTAGLMGAPADSSGTEVQGNQFVLDGNLTHTTFSYKQPVPLPSILFEDHLQGEVQEYSVQESHTLEQGTSSQDDEHASIAERIKKGFSSKNDFLEYCSYLVQHMKNEHFFMYGIDSHGRFEILKYLSGDNAEVFVQSVNLVPEIHTNITMTKIGYLHTHPKMLVEDFRRVAGEQNFSIPSQEFLDNLPFSTPDLNTAILIAGIHRYDDALHFGRSIYTEKVEHENVVVSPSGTWTYRVDPSHPYIGKLMEMRGKQFLSHERVQKFLQEHPHIPPHVFLSLIKTVDSPNPEVKKRTIQYLVSQNLSDTLPDIEFIAGLYHAYNNTGMINEDGEDLHTNLQLGRNDSMMSNAEYINKFIDYYKNRGVSITYTPNTSGEKE